MIVWAYVSMCLIYGTTFLGIRIGDEAGMPPFLFGALRFGAAGVFTLIIIALRNRAAFPRTWSLYGRLVSVGLFTTTGVFAIVYDAENYVPSGYAALMSATMPFLVMILGRMFYQQAIIRVQYLALAIGFIGVFAIAWPGLHQGIPHWLFTTIALIIAQILASIGALQSRRIMANGLSPFVVNGFQLLFGGLGLFLLTVFTEGLSFRNVHAVGAGVSALLYLTIAGSMIASTLFYWLVSRVGTLIASTWTYVSPLIAVVAGHLWLSERIYPLTIVGTVGIIVGLILLNIQVFRKMAKNRMHWLEHRLSIRK